MKRLLLALLITFFVVAPAAAHGTAITYTATGATVAMVALFDDKEPMAEAQVIVYAPNDPETVYLRGTTDEEGRFSFDIDTDISGTWDVTVRVASHGEIIRIPVTDSGDILPQGGRVAAIPRSLLAIVVIALLGGVALYFSRTQKKPAA